jgi:hypothetical protein
MANQEAKLYQCPSAGDCGFISFWNKAAQENSIYATPPPAGMCPKNPDKCGRLNPHVPFQLEDSSPRSLTHDETIILLPLIPNDSGRPQRRLPGGGHSG